MVGASRRSPTCLLTRKRRTCLETLCLGQLRAVNGSLLEKYRLKGQNSLLGRIQLRADGKLAVSPSYSHASGECYDVSYDRVICRTGFVVDPPTFRDWLGPELTIRGQLPALTSAYESTNIRGLLFARAIAQARNPRRAMRPFIHCFRYRARALAPILAMRATERRRRTGPPRTA